MDKNLKVILITVGIILVSGLVKLLPGLLRGNNEPVAWTPEFTKSMYESSYNGLEGVFADSDSRKITTCIIDKLKIKYPKGLEVVDKDAYENEIVSLGKDCMKGMTLHFTWSQKLIDRIQRKARKTAWVEAMNDLDKTRFCTCYIDRLKQIRPNGIVDSLKQADIDSATAYCRQRMTQR